MDSHHEQLQKDFSEWGKIFKPSTPLTDENSPVKQLIDKNFSKDNSKLVLSVCPDDINRLPERKSIENTIKENFGGEFHLSNLAGYPIGG